MACSRFPPGPFGVPALLLVLAAPGHASWTGAQLKTLEVDTAAPATLTLAALAEPPGRIGVRRVDPATGIPSITALDPAAGPLELTLEPRETLLLLFREAQPGTCLEAALTLAGDPAGTLGWFSLRLDPEAEASPWTLTPRSLHRDCRMALRDGDTLRIQHRPPTAGDPGPQEGAGASLETKVLQAGAGCSSLAGLGAKLDRLQASLRALGERGEYLQAFEQAERQYDQAVASQEQLVGLRDRQIERARELKALVQQEGGGPRPARRGHRGRHQGVRRAGGNLWSGFRHPLGGAAGAGGGLPRPAGTAAQARRGPGPAAAGAGGPGAAGAPDRPGRRKIQAGIPAALQGRAPVSPPGRVRRC